MRGAHNIPVRAGGLLCPSWVQYPLHGDKVPSGVLQSNGLALATCTRPTPHLGQRKSTPDPRAPDHARHRSDRQAPCPLAQTLPARAAAAPAPRPGAPQRHRAGRAARRRDRHCRAAARGSASHNRGSRRRRGNRAAPWSRPPRHRAAPPSPPPSRSGRTPADTARPPSPRPSLQPPTSQPAANYARLPTASRHLATCYASCYRRQPRPLGH